MPRKSAAALAVVPNVSGKPLRLVPRQNMPEPVRDLFVELVASVDATHFRSGDAALLEQYAQAILLARRAYDELDATSPITEDGKVSPWNIVLEKAHRSSVALAGRLRLAPQLRERSRTAGRRKDSAGSFYQQMDGDE